jgi:hypothetical protein
MYFKVLELCTSFLFEPCILRYLKYIWKKNFPCNFTIYFYDPSLYYIFRIVSKMCFWQPWIQHLYLRNILGVNPLGCLFGPVPILERIFRKKSSRKFVWVQCVYLEKKKWNFGKNWTLPNLSTTRPFPETKRKSRLQV